MMERRQHWDFDLVEAVKAASTKYGAGTVDSAYAAIAAVEDWQELEKHLCKSDRPYHCVTHDTQWLDDESERCEYKRMIDAESSIQRVRELRQKWRHDVIATMGKALPGGVLSVPLNAVESQLGRALDGDGK